MAVARRASPPEVATFDEGSALYSLRRTYHIDGEPDTAIGTAHAVLPGGIPQTVPITHHDGITTVTLVAVAREARIWKVDPVAGNAITEIAVTYEGHVATVFPAMVDFGTTSSEIKMSLDDPPLNPSTSIGPEMEGTTRMVPEYTMSITRVIPYDDAMLYNYIYITIPSLVSTVNEDNWGPAACDFTNFSLGTWLYLGASCVRERDGAYAITHNFLGRQISNPDDDGLMHIFPWYFTKKEEITPDGGGAAHSQEVPDGEIQKSKIQLIAGVDTILDFSDLGL